MKYRVRSFLMVAVALLGLWATAKADNDFHWRWPLLLHSNSTSADILLTDNNGARALAFGTGGTPPSSFDAAAVAFSIDGHVRAWRRLAGSNYGEEQPNTPPCNGDACIAVTFGAGNPQKHVFWPSIYDQNVKVEYADTFLVNGVPIPTPWGDIEEWDAQTDYMDDVAIAATHDNGLDYVYVCYFDDPEGDDDPPGVYVKVTANRGGSWNGPYPVMEEGDYNQIDNFSLAASGSTVYLALHDEGGDVDVVRVFRSVNHGSTWAGTAWASCAAEPCIAALGDRAVVVWVETDDGNDPGRVKSAICYKSGGTYYWQWPENPHFNQSDDFSYSGPSVWMVNTEAGDTLVNIAAELNGPEDAWVSSTWGEFKSGNVIWSPWREHWLGGRYYEVDEFANPCIGMRIREGDTAQALCVWTDDGTHSGGDGFSDLYGNYADWKYRYPNNVVIPPVHFDGTGPRIRVVDGITYYAARVGANLHCGVAREDGFLEPVLLGSGTLSAIAADAGGNTWACFLCDDTVWCMMGEYGYRAVYAGGSAAVPGQPSIVCYPNQANGVYAAGLVFPVYDTAGGTSRIMFARACTSGVVLDTIESAQNLGDSLPCISVFRTDTLVVTWQHGDSTLASMLCDYGPGTSGQVPAWSSPSLVSANGYHPMNAFDEGGSALNVVWTRNNGSNYAIQRATCDLATTAFGNWSQSATPGDTGAYEKSNPVFAGLGVTCWQQKGANGKWNIIGFVRGDTVTLVANDTDACHPHAVAESSAISPSIDQVRVHLLYTAGVAFEVDSGVYDTGETRYVCESLNVSHACSDATKANNGAKLLRKNGSDSLFSVYSDLDNAVVFAWSASGDTWQRSVMASGRDYPAIAEDSSGKRWVVMRKLSQSLNPDVQEAYYRNGSSWTGPETLYTVSGTTLGSASLSGSSDTTSGIAYAAFLSTATGGTQSLILAKFNGTTVSTYTVATGSSLGDPSVTVEPYKSDSDRIHVTWEDNGTIKYVMDTDGRSTSIASNWTSTYDLTGRGTVGQHPSINTDHDQIVVAWAQGDTTDIHSRKRSTDSAYNNWEAAANLSNTAGKFSDWPTIAMGDSVIIAWEERRSTTDYDILVCVDFADTLNIADNSTKSSYPHVLFQTQDSTPYVHLVYCEEPQSNYYEVGYNKCDLKEAGEGQQSASQTPIPTKPVLNACRPNPFRSHTQISYALPSAGNVSLQVYDVTGRTVRTLASGHQKAGSYSVSWDAKDSRGRQVPRGVYFYRLDTPGFRSVKKAVVAR